MKAIGNPLPTVRLVVRQDRTMCCDKTNMKLVLVPQLLSGFASQWSVMSVAYLSQYNSGPINNENSKHCTEKLLLKPR